MLTWFARFVLILVVLFSALACAGVATPTPTPLPTDTPLPAPTRTPIPTSTPLPTDTPVPTPTPSPPPAAAAPNARYQKPGDYVDQILIDGVGRWFTVHLPPSYQPGAPMPLVVNLHAYSSTAFGQEELSGMNAKADEEGFVVVNPQALNDPPSWWGPLPGEAGQSDRDFFEALLIYLQEMLSIDPARIYATGMSNGGTMTYRLGCDMANTFAAIAPVAGGHVAHPFCKPERPVSVLVIHGTDDQVIPYYGNDTDSPPVHTWLEAWASHDDCDPTPSTDQPYPGVTSETWSDCAEGTMVVLYSLEGGGHTWPGALPGMTSGAVFPGMDATDVIWTFFKAHPRP